MAGSSRISSDIKDRAEGIKESAAQTAQEAKGLVQETASTLGQKASDAASNVGQQAREMAHTAERRAEEARSSVGQGLSQLAGSLREKAPQEGMLGSAAEAVASRLESGGRYLQSHDLGDITNDMAGVIRQYPIPALLCAFGVGLLLGMAARR